MIYLLDTSVISAVMRADAGMAAWLSSIGADDRVVICTIARGEILFGLERLAQGRRRTELEEKARKLFAVLPSEPIPPAAGDAYAKINKTFRYGPRSSSPLSHPRSAQQEHGADQVACGRPV